MKKSIPSLNQIKKFLKKEKNVSKVELDVINDENVINDSLNHMYQSLTTFQCEIIALYGCTSRVTRKSF